MLLYPVTIELVDAFELPARSRAILVDRAAIVAAQERAAAVAVAQHLLEHDLPIPASNRHITRPRREAPALAVALQQHRVVVPVLLAARRDALLKGWPRQSRCEAFLPS